MVDPKNLQEVRNYLQMHKDEIMHTYQAIGTGIGKNFPADNSYVIVVYLANKKQQPLNPVVLDNIPLQFVVTGEIKLHKKGAIHGAEKPWQ